MDEDGVDFGWIWAEETMGGDWDTMPSVNLIRKGLANEAKFLIKRAMGDVHDQYRVVQAENNAEEIWNNILALAKVQDPDAPLVWGEEDSDGNDVPVKDSMLDPKSPVATVLKYIYQQESFVYHELNKAARFLDKSKLETLGPFAQAFSWVIYKSQMFRTDIDPSKFAKCTLWRGAGMTNEEINEFKSHLGKKEIQLWGYTSTSTSRNQAMTFAWENETTGHQKVLFKILWHRKNKHYYLDAGAYDYEHEIVLYDSVKLKVLEVKKIFNQKDEKLHTLIVLGTFRE